MSESLCAENELAISFCVQLCHFTNFSFAQFELQKTIEAQARELELMSSSWYDLQSRLQNNNVTMSRYRHGTLADAQKGWLAKQRSVVAGR